MATKVKDVHILIQNFALTFSKRVPQDVTNQIVNTPIQNCVSTQFRTKCAGGGSVISTTYGGTKRPNIETIKAKITI